MVDNDVSINANGDQIKTFSGHESSTPSAVMRFGYFAELMPTLEPCEAEVVIDEDVANCLARLRCHSSCTRSAR